MPITIPDRIGAARSGTNPAVICKVPSGWVVLCDTQFLSGYCILLADPPITSLNELSRTRQQEFLHDMTIVGDALLQAMEAYRINYVIAGNTDPFLHAHIIPRYRTEPDDLRKGLPWSHPKSERDSMLFNYERDLPLMKQIGQVIHQLL
jgi:diadenosine tetraphosphate (Ap4A) HIT family hydrolase